MMQTMFENVQSQFMSLGALLSGLDFDKDLVKADVIAKVHDTLSDTYILINQGFCESTQMCEKCVSNRDQLGELTRMMDDCEDKGELGEEAFLSLAELRDNIPNILIKMESVYLENIRNLEEI